MAMTYRSQSSSLRVLLALAVVSTAGACKPKASAPTDRAEILIGATLPLTGAEARIGGFFKEGYDLAFDEVTRQGGLEVGGKKLPGQADAQRRHHQPGDRASAWPTG